MCFTPQAEELQDGGLVRAAAARAGAQAGGGPADQEDTPGTNQDVNCILKHLSCRGLLTADFFYVLAIWS